MQRLALPVLLVCVYVGFGAAYQSAVPLFETPDEASHLEYVAFLAQERRLPLYGAEPEVPGEGMQAPLYYALAAPLFALGVRGGDAIRQELHRANLWIYEREEGPVRENLWVRPNPARTRQGQRWFEPEPALDPLLRLRWLSRAFGALTVLLTCVAVRRALADERLAAVAAALVALNPQFLFVSGSVSNDAAAAAIGACALLLVVRGLAEPSRRRRDYLWLGLLASVGLLTKTSTLPGLVVAGLALFATDAGPLRRRVSSLVPGLALSLVLAAPYLIWNTLQRGDPLGTTAVWESAEQLAGFTTYGGFGNFFARIYWDWTFESYWGRFGWMELRVPKWTYLAFFALTWTGLLGLVLGAGRDRARALRRYLLAVALASLAAHVWLNVQTPQPQGRHLFPALPQISALLAIGLGRIGGGDAARLGWPAAGGFLALLAGLALFCLLGVIRPAYA